MEAFFDSIRDIVAVVLIFGLPVIAVLMAFISSMIKKKRDKEIRQLIIENHTDPETAKLLINEPKKQKRELGPFNLGNLRAACILLGLGFGALIDWISCIETKSIYFWLIIASGIGIGLLCSFLIEMHLFKKYGKQLTSPSAEPNDKE